MDDAFSERRGPALLHARFEEQASRTPVALAVAGGDGRDDRLTYRELEARSRRLAAHLIGLGVGPEARVGLCVERAPEMVVALLGILRAGGAYVALDPAYPRQRLAFMLEDSGADVLVAERRTVAALPEAGIARRLVLLDDPLPETDAPLPRRVLPENPAYLVYTSGSTGRPKGVVLTHRSASALVGWALGAFTRGELAGVLASTSLCFDLSVFEVFAPLSAGGAVIVAADALELPSLPAEPPVTLLNTVPSAGAELLRSRGIPASVQVANFCGEALPAPVADGIYRTTSVRRVMNLYGPSEDTVYSTAAEVEPGAAVPPIGRPIPGTRAYVTGPDGELRDEGELLLAGEGLARGYLGRPDLTAERFLPDPWSGAPGERLYRTGDLVRRRPDGELLFLGRIDQQIKLRGYRIELGEIEAALLSHPAVREAVVTFSADGGGPRLVAWVVLDEPAPGAGELRSHLARTLPEPMIPAAFARLDALPKTLNGKLDRKALPEDGEPLPERGNGEERSALEEVLALLWAEALEVERVEVDDDLFALGARADRTAWVLARMRDLMGVTVPERAGGAAMTVAGLARIVEPSPPSSGGEGSPLSFAQHRLWFLERLRPGEPTYNEPAWLDFRGPISVAALAAALSEIVRRHEVLRSRFGEVDGEPFQEAGAPMPIPVPVMDLEGLPETEIERVVLEEVRRPFDLGRPPLLRALLIRRGQDDHALILTVHHIAYDGLSRVVFFAELAALYGGAPLPGPAGQCADAAVRQRREWHGVPAERLAPWLRRLMDSAPLELPADRSRPSDPSSDGATLRLAVDPSVTARLRSLARAEGSTLFRLLLAVFAALLARLSGRGGGTVGTTAAARRPGMEGVLGFFVNLLPIPLDVSASGLRDLLRDVGTTVREVVALQELPYQRMAALGLDGEDLFRVLFQLQPVFEPRLPGLEAVWRPVETGTAKVDLETTLIQEGDGLEGYCQFRTDVHDAAAVATFAARFTALLEAVATEPDRPLADQPLLAGVERRQVLSVRRRRTRGAAVSAAPLTPTEELVAQAWAEVLGLETAGRRESFFHLGGHSLLAARVLARIHDTLGVQLPVRALFRAPTVETLAEAVNDARAAKDSEAPPPLVRVPGGPHPLSFAQEALWLVSRLEPDGPLYNILLAWRLRGPLDRAALAESVRAVARRHEVLRSRLIEKDGDPVQETAAEEIDVPWIDLSLVPSRLEDLAREEAARRFDLAAGPLLRARLILLGPDDHALLITIHHTAFDGWSQGLLERAISQVTAPPSLQYSDFARWQRSSLTEAVLAPRLAWWRTELAGAPAALDLATDRPRPALHRARGASVRRPVPPGLPAKLRSLARAEGATPFMILLAAFQALLQRAAGQDDVLVGAPVARRERVELEGLIGLFVETVVLRGRSGGTFQERVARARETALAAWAHAVPLELLVAGLGVERGAARNPLFQVMLALQDAPSPGLSLPGITSAPFDPGPATAMFDLTLTLEHEAASLEHDVDLFDATTAGRLLDSFLTLLSGALDEPGRRVSDLPLVSPAEARELLLAGPELHEEPRLVIDAFAAQVRSDPGAVALIAGERKVSYGELGRWSDMLAGRTRSETLVALSTERSPELIAELLAVWKGGAAWVYIDPELPEERRRMLAEDLTPGGEVAYLLYTSGSSGMPKPVGVTQGALAAHVQAAADLLDLRATDRVLAFASPSFDVFLEELLPALIRGAAVVLRGTEPPAPAGFSDFAADLGLTVADLPTAYWRQWVREAAAAPPALRVVTVGGEAMAAEDARRWHSSPLRSIRLVNAYGPTEAVITATALEVDAEAASAPRFVGLGRPLRGRRAVVLDRDGGLLPMGVAGELCLGGEPLALGYFGRPGLTAERFVPDPWSDVPGGRLYRTGDRARVLPGETLEFLGRLDHQVKLRGVRIEPGEVEAALVRHPAVREAAVDLRTIQPGEAALVAWVALRTAVPVEALQAFLRGSLPAALVPSTIVVLDELPLTPAGKVDRRALTSPQMPSRDESSWRTPTEEMLACIWIETLGPRAAGADASFFALGGHSLLAVRLLSRVRDAFGVDLPVRTVFAAPTVRELAQRVDEARRAGETTALPPLVRLEGEVRAPLSFAQQRLWFLDRLQPGGSTYNVAFALALRGALKPDALARGLTATVRRHEALRTVFVEIDGQPWQEIRRPAPVPLPLVDLRSLPSIDRDGELARIARDAGRRPFDLARGPLLRAAVVRMEEDGWTLLLALHHIVSDAWSDELLGRELSALYSEDSRALPELPVQYADYARWQRSWPEEYLAVRLDAWTRKLAGLAEVSTLELPADRPRPPVQTFRGALERLAVPAGLTAALRDLALRQGATLFLVLLAAWQALLARLTGQTDLPVGSPVANRGRAELEGLIGFFVNLIVLRGDLSGNPTGEEILARARRTALDAYAHEDLPFERLVDELRPERDLSRQPLVQVMLALQETPSIPLSLPGVEVRPLELADSVARFDLTLYLAPAEGGLAGGIEHSTDLFDCATVQRFGTCFLRVLAQLAERPTVRLAELELLAPSEHHQILREWNDTQAESPAGLIHQLFEARADLQPEAVALLWRGERLSYGDLEKRANRVAHLLRRIGVERGAAVGIWMERSPDMVVAVLAVLQAGCAYLPVDPSWPAGRAEAVLASARALLTRSALLPAVEDLQWKLPLLDHVLCLDMATAEPPVEALDPESVRALWDHVAERAVDRVTAGGFVHASGLPFSDTEVDEYRDRVLGLAEPWLQPDAHVLEIGCGAGLLLWEMARRAGRCVGLDPSPVTQERNRRRKEAAGVELLTGFAHEAGELFPAGSFNLIVLASTLQFFPGPRYLERIVEQAVSLLVPGGALLVADVPDARRTDAPKILHLDEDWFRDLVHLPEVEEIAVLHRNEGFDNELGLRYDVIVTRAAMPKAIRPRRKSLWTGWHVEREPATRLAVSGSPDDIAYVIHTSGSTGRPKGIAVQHRPVINLIRGLNPRLGLGPDDRVLFVTSLAFDLSVWDLFGVLAAGGSIHIASEDDLRDPAELVRVLCEEPVTVWDSAPAALAQLVPLFPAEAQIASRLRLVMLSGDWIPVTLPDRVRTAFPHARVLALGGATEATVWSNAFPVGEVDPRWPSIPYGRPLPNARYHVLDVLDVALSPCPAGVPGDLYIGGGCLSVGYAGQPDLTAASFLPDPFADEAGARLYRTGDRARYRMDGNLELLGRIDQQVKLRGFRIELGEIEAVLARHPEVREAVAAVREDTSGGRRLVAYVVAASPLPDLASDLAAFLRLSLPEPMIPSAFVRLDALPVTANGKLDRRALPAPRWEGSIEVSAVTPTEERLLAVWREILGVERLGVHDSFFDLGGHSLLATRLLARLREDLGAEVPLRTLFQSPTVAGLAAALDQGNGMTPQAEPPLRPVPRGGDLPLSASQLRQWFLVQLDPADPAYTLPLALDLQGSLDAGALDRALREIVRRHEVLRTAFPAAGGRPTGMVTVAPVALCQIDLSALPDPEAAADRIAAAEADHPFDLARGPLLRLALLRLGPERHRLLVTVHHIVFDGWSFGVLVRELASLYESFVQGKPSLLPDLPIQYADYAAWQHQWLAGPAAAAQAAWWRERLASASRSLTLPTDRPRPPLQSSRAGLLPLDVPPGLGRDLRGLAAREGVTLFMAVLAGWAAVLGRLAGQDDLNIGTFVANRRRAALEGLLGLFVNTLALRVEMQEDPSWRGLLEGVRMGTLESFERQELPFERLLEELDLDRDLSRTPLFQVLFGVESFALPPVALPGLTVRPLPTSEHDRAAADLALWVREEGDGVAGWLKYAVDLFDRTTAARLARHLVTFLAAAVADPGARLSDLPVLAAAERHQLLSEWGTGADRPEADDLLPVHERIADWAVRTPDAPAVEQGDVTLSYAELHRRARALAGELRRRGAGPESVVGVAAERTPETIVALLGILQAGAAYLPLDPGLPPARLAQLVGESKARLVVTGEGLFGVSGEAVTVDLHSMAYVLYTSGSTGTPKGVVIEHGALTRFVTTARNLYGIAPGDRVLQFATLSFDISVEEIFTTLAAGATLVLRDDEMLASPSFFLDRCRDLGITVLDLPTAYAHELGAALAAGARLPGSLRLVILAGERALPGPVRAWLAAGGDRLRVLDTYGPTEATVVATASELSTTAPALTLGRPIRGARVWLLDASLEPVPAGVPGEICLGGAGLGRGYLARPDLTAERFLPSPFDEPGSRLYRTGDLARWLPDGRLDFLGRTDDQVKLRGFRIEPGEIAAVLSSHPGVGEAVVLARATESGARLTAWVAVSSQLDTAELRAWLKDRLPAYMVPADLVLLDALPHTARGKIDRAALPAPEGPRRERSFAAPETPAEERIADLWRPLLGVAEVGRHDDFFDLGGHSLLAPQLLAQLHDTFGVDLPLRLLFEAPTVARLAAAVEAALLDQLETLTEEEAAGLLGVG